MKFKYTFIEKDRLKLGIEIFDEFLNSTTSKCKLDIEKKYISTVEKSLLEQCICPIELFDECELAIEKKLGTYQNQYRDSKFYGENKSKSETSTPSTNLLSKESSRRLSQKNNNNMRLSSKFNLNSKTSPPESQRGGKRDDIDGKVSPRKSFRFSISNLSKKSSTTSKKNESPPPDEIKDLMSFDDSKRKVPKLDFDK